MPRPRKQTLWDKIKELRKKKKLSQDALAKIAQIPTASVSQVEAWGGNPTIRTLVSITRALDTSIDELVKDLFFDKKETKKKE